jgi:hypothetical protein
MVLFDYGRSAESHNPPLAGHRQGLAFHICNLTFSLCRMDPEGEAPGLTSIPQNDGVKRSQIAKPLLLRTPIRTQLRCYRDVLSVGSYILRHQPTMLRNWLHGLRSASGRLLQCLLGSSASSCNFCCHSIETGEPLEACMTRDDGSWTGGIAVVSGEAVADPIEFYSDLNFML